MSHNDIKPTVSMSEAASSHTDLEKEGFAETTFNGTRIQRVAELDKAAGNGVQTVRSAKLVAAVTAGGGTNAWSRAALTMYACIFVSFLGSCANGYDGSLMNAINGMDPYQRKFESGRLGSTTGIIFAIYTVGNMVGSFIGGPVTDRYGRRFGMFFGGLLIILGTVVTATASTRGQLIAGRFILGFGIAPVTTACPSYCVEIAPPAWRGRATGFYNCGWFGGSIPAAAVTLGTSFMSTDWAWRLPIIFQCVPALVLCTSVWFLPESPRWLIANSRDDEARAIIVKYHGNGDPNHPIVELEWDEMHQDIATDASDKRWWDYSELFKTRSARRRLFMVLLMGIFGQFSGNGLGYFNLSIYESVGYDYIMQFVLNLVNSIVSAVGAGIGVSIADRAPRRPILVWGTLACAAMLAGNAALSRAWAGQPVGMENLSIGRGAVTFYFLFNIIYSFTYTPLQALYPVECLQTNTRAKGMSFYAFTVSAIGFINTYASPIGLQNLKYNFIWVFVGWDVVESIIWYFAAIETQGRTLEELDEIFKAARPVAASKAKKHMIIQEDGNIVVEK